MLLYVGEGPRGSNGASFPLHRISVFYSATHNQTGPLSCWFPSGWACARPRPLWVSPTTSPVRLGVSPAAAPTPKGVFNQRSEALFPRAGALGCVICFARLRSSGFICEQVWGQGVLPAALPALFSATLSLALSAYLYANVGSQGLLVLGLPAPFVPHYLSLGPATATRVLSTLAALLCPSYLSGCRFLFIYLVSDFLAVPFSVSSGCARRRSVSTYASILVFPYWNFYSAGLHLDFGTATSTIVWANSLKHLSLHRSIFLSVSYWFCFSREYEYNCKCFLLPALTLFPSFSTHQS